MKNFLKSFSEFGETYAKDCKELEETIENLVGSEIIIGLHIEMYYGFSFLVGAYSCSVTVEELEVIRDIFNKFLKPFDLTINCTSIINTKDDLNTAEIQIRKAAAYDSSHIKFYFS
jgi:hypothetical protein